MIQVFPNLSTMPPPIDQCCPLVEVIFDSAGLDQINELTQGERQFAYWMVQAARSAWSLYLIQRCPHPEVLEKVWTVHSREKSEELTKYLVYLIVNYGVHFVREDQNNKYTPQRLGLNSITPDLFRKHEVELSELEERYLFDPVYQPSLQVPGKITESGGGFYGPGLTDDHYQQIPDEHKQINGYHFLSSTGNPQSTTYSIRGNRGARAIKKTVEYLQLAQGTADQYPDSFDRHTVRSLDHLIGFFQTGEEEKFRQHSREWLQMSNPRVEYVFGFIEYYEDPKGTIGSFQADVTVKSLDIKQLLQLLPSFEQRFPFPPAWKRQNMDSIPNAASAYRVICTGDLGPTLSTIAYCLPNYEDLRSSCGSKQVMYNLPTQIRKPELWQQLYLTPREREIYQRFSPDFSLKNEVANLLTTLHETIGHASGTAHPELSAKAGIWKNGLEEMRAEILALHTAITFHQEILDSGILSQQARQVDQASMTYLYLQGIAGKAWNRWQNVPANHQDITQAHTLADTGIMHYLIDQSNGGIRLETEEISVPDRDKPLTAFRLVIDDLSQASRLVQLLAIEVQWLTSTAAEEEIDQLMRRYANSTRHPDYSRQVQELNAYYRDGLKGSVYLFPEWDWNEGDPKALKPDSTEKHFREYFEDSRELI